MFSGGGGGGGGKEGGLCACVLIVFPCLVLFVLCVLCASVREWADSVLPYIKSDRGGVARVLTPKNQRLHRLVLVLPSVACFGLFCLRFVPFPTG